MKNPLDYRPAPLVLGMLDYVYEADEAIPWAELVSIFVSDDVAWKTAEGVIYDLVSFGALHRVGKPADTRRHDDTRALKPTPLGRAWLERELLELPSLPEVE